jgi:DNA repair protein RadC
VLVHNHPSGDPEPSEEDIAISRRLVQVGELVGIGILDHVIIATRGVVSLRSRQLL